MLFCRGVVVLLCVVLGFGSAVWSHKNASAVGSSVGGWLTTYCELAIVASYSQARCRRRCSRFVARRVLFRYGRRSLSRAYFQFEYLLRVDHSARHLTPKRCWRPACSLVAVIRPVRPYCVVCHRQPSSPRRQSPILALTQAHKTTNRSNPVYEPGT